MTTHGNAATNPTTPHSEPTRDNASGLDEDDAADAWLLNDDEPEPTASAHGDATPLRDERLGPRIARTPLPSKTATPISTAVHDALEAMNDMNNEFPLSPL